MGFVMGLGEQFPEIIVTLQLLSVVLSKNMKDYDMQSSNFVSCNTSV
jgi:hypothetical protein